MSVYSNGGFVGISRRLLEPITFVGGKSVGATGTTSNIVISLRDLVGGVSSAPMKGDIVVVAFSTGSTVSRTLVIDGYTSVADLYSSDTYDSNLEVGYKIMGDVPDDFVTLTGGSLSTADAYAVAVHVWRYVDPVTPLDVATTTSTGLNTALVVPPAITPITPGVVILVAGAAAHASGAQFFASPEDAMLTFFTQGGNSTNDSTIGIGAYSGWDGGQYVPGTFRFTTTDSTANSWTAATLALRPKYNRSGSSGIWSLQARSFANISYFVVEFLVIAGGGGGGTPGNDSGGGGAGGYRSSVSGESSGGGASAEGPLNLQPNILYAVTVGAGGAAGTNGSNSIFHTITSIGGGRGCPVTSGQSANTGGSGGGGGATGSATGASGTTGQGYAGGSYVGDAGGGGGAGGPGQNGDTAGQASYGGIGVTSSITGTAVARAGGGGGGNDTAGYGVAVAGGGAGTATNGGNGSANTGGGGGGGGGTTSTGGAGGSGVVILRYPATRTIFFGAGVTGTETTVGNNKVAVITAGTGTVSWS